ncbi:MAG: succinate dehydrogenase/fumarate reductase iron-sulfur subunit [Deltaproteobacteria bacterium]|nr:succinate dehydrogenase/fumarate reductase iron-sulfur subunit [Deltaproteobacteria bacterium]
MPGTDGQAAVAQGQAPGRRPPPRARPHHVGPLRHGPHRRGAAAGAEAHPRAARALLARGCGARQRIGAEPVARARGPRRRLPRVRRADVPRRARARRVLRRPLPRGTPERRGRGGARRRTLLPRGGLGVSGRRSPGAAAHRAAGLRERQAFDPELQVVRVRLKIWRQSGPNDTSAGLRDYELEADEHMSLLETLDLLNAGLIRKGELPVAFEHDCREGICGACSLVVNGVPHGPRAATTTCQIHMREFKSGETITLEPFRARSFPVIKDLVVDRSSFDRVMAAGGYVSVRTGAAPDANAMPIGKHTAEKAFDYAACIGCGACVAACPNASAMLFVGAKVSHLSLLPQGKVERSNRVSRMVERMDAEGFGGCTNHGECEAVCPKSIKLDAIATLNRELMRAAVVDD